MNRKKLVLLVTALVETIDDCSELDGLCALLCAIGAACLDEYLERELLEAITPTMFRKSAEVMREKERLN